MNLENQFIALADQISEEAYERNASGEMSALELKELYSEIGSWAIHTERLISLLYVNHIQLNNNNNV